MKTKKYLKYSLGSPKLFCHVDAVHAMDPDADERTGDIVHQTIEETGSAGIISTVSRTKLDLNRPPNSQNDPAIVEYREAILDILKSKDLLLNGDLTLMHPYLHLAIHGMRDDRPTDFEIGTRHGKSCDKSIASWFHEKLQNSFPATGIGVDNIFPGDASKEFHRHGDSKSEYAGYGANFHTIQLEISRELRYHSQNEVVAFLSDALIEFGKHSGR